MASRRQFLAAASAGATAGLAGRAETRDHFYAEGRIREEAITVRWRDGARRWQDRPLQLVFDTDEGHLCGRYDPAYTGDVVAAPDEVAVGDRTHAALAGTFESVEYPIGFPSPSLVDDAEDTGCRNTDTDRPDFSRVQLGDHARVVHHGTDYDVLDVLADREGIRTTDVHEFSSAELHADHGVPDPPAFE
jgi:hypothetical protein